MNTSQPSAYQDLLEEVHRRLDEKPNLRQFIAEQMGISQSRLSDIISARYSTITLLVAERLATALGGRLKFVKEEP
jgi:hypothetical protein